MQRINKTRFMEKEELAQNLTKLKMDGEQYETGGVPLLVQNGNIYVDGSDSHTLVFGATGSKKTRLFVFPTIGILVRAGESYVVSDPKGELYGRTSKDAKDHGYMVESLNFRDFSKGSRWNILDLPCRYYNEGKMTKALELIDSISRMIIGPAHEDKFWTENATNILVGLILYMMDKKERNDCNIKTAAGIWTSYLGDRKNFVKRLKEEYQNDSLVYQKLSSLDNSSSGTVGSIEAFVNMGFNRFLINPEFMEYISENEISLEELATTKSAVYLVTPDEKPTYDFVVSLFVRQYYEVLIETAQKNDNNKLTFRTNFLIDEFANLPTIEGMDTMITASRSRDIRFFLVIQALSQLTEKYGDYKETICSNCTNWIYLFSREVELLKMLQELCGEVIYDNDKSVPLCSVFDLQHLNKEKGEALVLSGRNLPCLSNLADIDEYPYPIGEMDRPVRENKPAEEYQQEGTNEQDKQEKDKQARDQDMEDFFKEIEEMLASGDESRDSEGSKDEDNKPGDSYKPGSTPFTLKPPVPGPGQKPVGPVPTWDPPASEEQVKLLQDDVVKIWEDASFDQPDSDYYVETRLQARKRERLNPKPGVGNAWRIDFGRIPILSKKRTWYGDEREARRELAHDRRKCFLVAVGPCNIIMAVRKTRAEKIEDTTAILQMQQELAKRWKKAVFSLSFYKARKGVGTEYNLRLQLHPEQAYVTLDELGKENFICVKEGLPWCEDPYVQYEITYSRKRTTLQEKVLDTQKFILPNYGDEFGKDFAALWMSRIANQEYRKIQSSDTPEWYAAAYKREPDALMAFKGIGEVGEVVFRLALKNIDESRD